MFSWEKIAIDTSKLFQHHICQDKKGGRQKLKAIILAGGKGTRLQPLTYTIPKPMLPLYDKPVMEYSIELLKKHGITEIGITLQYRHEQIIEYFGDGSQWGVTLTYFIEKSLLEQRAELSEQRPLLRKTVLLLVEMP